MSGPFRWFWRYAMVPGVVLAAIMALTPAPARAQEQPPQPGQEDKGRPLDGYIATGCLVGLTLFLVAKSARRTIGR
jgi:hypothetical protein